MNACSSNGRNSVFSVRETAVFWRPVIEEAPGMSISHNLGIPGSNGPRSTKARERRPALNDFSDKQLLAEYVGEQNQAAFAALVDRHAPLVWNVCRRVLGETDDAEDAFQATFIVLLRKAGLVQWKNSIAGWLYQVSHRAAWRCRSQAARRTQAITHSDLADRSRTIAQEEDEERRRVIEEEIARLPEALRLPVIMCYLQGLTNVQAASRIGCPKGTVASRLSRARSRLRRRLRARGFAFVTAGALTAYLSREGTAAVAPQLTGAVIAASKAGAGAGVLPAQAAHLAQFIERRLLWRRLVTFGTGGAVALVLTGLLMLTTMSAGSRNERGSTSEPPRGETATVRSGAVQQIGTSMSLDQFQAPVGAQPGAPANSLRGGWILAQWESFGIQLPIDAVRAVNLEFAGDRCVLDDVIGVGLDRMDAQVVFDAQSPDRSFDLVVANDDQPLRLECLYSVSGDTLRLAIAPPGIPRPDDLVSRPGQLHTSFIFRRALPTGEGPIPRK